MQTATLRRKPADEGRENALRRLRDLDRELRQMAERAAAAEAKCAALLLRVREAVDGCHVQFGTHGVAVLRSVFPEIVEELAPPEQGRNDGQQEIGRHRRD